MLPPITYSVFINVVPPIIFKTLTTASGWDAWFTNGAVLDLRPGGEFIFRWKNWGPDRVTTEDHGKVLEIIPTEKFSFEWNPDVKPTIVTFTLSPRSGGTVVQITDAGFQTLDRFLGCATGWAEALILLKVYLEHGITYGEVPP